MKDSTETSPKEMGPNRTGIATSPIDAKRSIEGAEAGTPAEQVDFDPAGGIQAFRVKTSSKAGPVGTVPPPGTVKGATKAALKAIQGERASVLIDLLAARLAYERAGTRLYEAVLAKFDAGHPHEGGPTRAQLEHICAEELEHVGVLVECIEQLGADPTAMTPCADLQAMASQGLVQVVTDPRTTLSQALEAAMVAELADNESWQLLIDLAERMDQHEMAERFQHALEQEDEHLASVRGWLSASIMGQAGIDPTPPLEASPGERRRGKPESRRPAH